MWMRLVQRYGILHHCTMHTMLTMHTMHSMHSMHTMHSMLTVHTMHSMHSVHSMHSMNTMHSMNSMNTMHTMSFQKRLPLPPGVMADYWVIAGGGDICPPPINAAGIQRNRRNKTEFLGMGDIVFQEIPMDSGGISRIFMSTTTLLINIFCRIADYTFPM